MNRSLGHLNRHVARSHRIQMSFVTHFSPSHESSGHPKRFHDRRQFC